MANLHSAYARDWLNPQTRRDCGASSVHVIVGKLHEEDLPYHDSDMQIRDCSRQVTLDFSCSRSIGSINRRRRKIKILREHLDLIEVGLNKFEETL